jgi:hypothetical protein
MAIENHIMSTDPVDPVWQAERRADINFYLALLDVAEKLPEADMHALIREVTQTGLVTTGRNKRVPQQA